MKQPTSKFPHKGLYAIIDSKIHRDYGLARLFADIVTQSTIAVVQLRLKDIPVSTKLTLIKEIASIKLQRALCLIINDDCEFLFHPIINGLHVGQNDVEFLPPRDQHPGKIIGISVHNLDEANHAVRQGAHYIGYGAVFDTKTKLDTIPLGLTGLAEIVKQSALPVVAIGGITSDNIESIAKSGCQMAAVISALTQEGKFCGQVLHEKFLNAYEKK